MTIKCNTNYLYFAYELRQRTLELEKDIERQRLLELERAKTNELRHNLDMEKEKQTQVKKRPITLSCGKDHIFSLF